ncbi:MAG TPA: hypothetical protein VJP59_09125 [Gemmatimonadota bacterium]|nr:hypothetical protein [Gemmatimonadota bacterium]
MRFCALTLLATALLPTCSDGQEVVELRRYDLDSREGLIAVSGVAVDSAVTAEGTASLRVDAASPIRVLLFETGDIDVEDARLIYRARLRTEDLRGNAYLEMWCVFEELGEYFSRALHAPLSGTTDWTTQETPFFLEQDQNPDNVRLNLVVDGSGTVWIDDVRLLSASLRP